MEKLEGQGGVVDRRIGCEVFGNEMGVITIEVYGASLDMNHIS